MHATIALCLMMIGGPVPPEPEITNVPLQDDLSSANALQEQEWRERAKKTPLPHVPSMVEDNSSADRQYDRNSWRRNSLPTDPNARRNQQLAMPLPPTDPGELSNTGRMGSGTMPMLPGQGLGQGTGQNNFQSRSNYTGYTGPSYGQNLSVPNYGTGVLTSASGVPNTPSVSTAINGLNTYGNNVGAALSDSSLPYSGGGVQKPFSDYQRPNGYSPWMSLYTTPTNNGTMLTYTSNVQPQFQQQQFNAQVSEQIRGVQTMNRMQNSGTGNVEQQPGAGGGLVNPNGYMIYGGTIMQPAH